ncbi:amidohydrolase family protein [Bowmanella yangjiangensis]|uniref:Amidohydrolase family protein n=1 Tax=Bowmanella yangjiangensis TaxID=2811230 RepID=A0ABS3CT66_9ALTE|nr:amidohydrolase family protein [Bowmanella yangjiangensis]MBN7819704.1 amidohydrolase family protein [Bowmanella yangjiangensis]
MPRQSVALIGVDVLSSKGVLRAQTILLEDGRISKIGPGPDVSVPEHVKTLNLPNHTVIPGLVGMHDHTHMPGQTFMGASASRLWLASGVTTVQTAGSADFSSELALTEAIRAGDVAGPRIFPTAPYLTGPDGNGPMAKPKTPDEARQLVRDWSASGATWFKLYRHIQPHIAEAVIDEAHKLGRKVTGHLCSLTFSEAARLGIDSIEHGLISASDFIAEKTTGQCISNRSTLAGLEMDDPRIKLLIDLLVAKQVTLTSTLAIIESHFAHRPQADERSLVLLSETWREQYETRQHRLRQTGGQLPPSVLGKLMAFEVQFSKAGGRLVMGPDPGRHVLPGYGNQRGFELLVEAGFSVHEALEIATANGAEALGIGEKVGRISEGYLADLVILEGDLSADPGVIRNVKLVIKGGELYSPAKLLAGLEGKFGPQ